MIRIGVVCEGETDFFAVKEFFGEALKVEGIDVTFVPLQPGLDATQPSGGWGRVYRWFVNNSPSMRVKRYLDGGFFADDLDTRICDILLIQMDCDVLDDDGFRNFVSNNNQIDIEDTDIPKDRRQLIEKILLTWSETAELTSEDRDKHAFVPAVENTETWCVAAFRKWDDNVELLRGNDLGLRFMEVLHKSEGRSLPNFSKVSKNVKRREAFCERHCQGVKYLSVGSHSFATGVNRILNAIRSVSAL